MYEVGDVNGDGFVDFIVWDFYVVVGSIRGVFWLVYGNVMGKNF